MSMRKTIFNLAVISVVALFVIGGCSENDSGIGPAAYPTSNEVFVDEFGPSVTFEAFLGSKLDALQIDQLNTYQGSAALIVTVPDLGDPAGSYAGGAFTTGVARDLSGFNALTFWVKGSRNATLDVVGIGNDNTGTSRYTAEVNNLPVTTAWQQFTIPIPLASKLDMEQGLFYFAEGPEDGSGCQLWFDEIIFDSLGTIANPRPSLTPQTFDVEIDDTIDVGNGVVTFDVNGTDVDVSAMPGYFTFTSSNPSAVQVAANGTITAVGLGTSYLTASLGSVNTSGAITVNVNPAQAVPTTPAPTPTTPEADVISLYSDAYTDVLVDTWSTDWDVAELADMAIGSDSVKKYFDLSYAGIEFSTMTVDASGMTRFHMDVWTPESAEAPKVFKVKLVDFGANGVFEGGDDVEDEVIFDHNTMDSANWVSIDIPLASFTNLTTRGHLAQMIISGDFGTIYVDNIYFYDAGIQTAPTTSAPTPDEDPADVISMYSDAYTSISVDTWSAAWDNASVSDYTVGSDNMKKYSNLVVAGIEFRSNTIDASTMTHFHMDVWTPDATASPAVFKIKLVDFGADGVYGGGDDLEDELTFDHTTMNTGIWVSIDVPLSDFTDLFTRGHLGQMIISGDPDTVYVDNIYFYDSGIPTVPQEPAPTPTLAAGDVVSLFSDAYTDVPVETWSAPWDSATVTDFSIGSDNIKKYTYFLFAGIEFKDPTVDASTMTHFHMDVWTPDPSAAPATFRIKLVDFGANGVWDDGGDDVEHEITLDETTMSSSTWVSLDIPLTEFAGLTTKGHLAQLIISSYPESAYNTIYVDNVYFHK